MERINLVNAISNMPNSGSIEFSGAIFLTYTLNLGFFEKIIQPALEKAGCQNILILSDPDGYNEAIQFGRKHVRFAGTRYVCTFIPRRTNYVQHAKLMFLVGPEYGQLLIGSGNLTLHGYSKNFEVYTRFEYIHSNPNAESQYAFYIVNQLLKSIINEELSTQISRQQYQSITEKVDWIREEPTLPENLRIWHNYEESIWSQLLSWRQNSQFSGDILKSLHIFSPYYDADVSMLRKFLVQFLPDNILIRISTENSNLNGLNLQNNWPDGYQLPMLLAIKDGVEGRSDRLLHGKVIVGEEESGSWCLAGSANMTRAAFEKSWPDGSNLEMVVFRWSPNPEAFNDLINQATWTEPLAIEDVENPVIYLRSDQPKEVTSETVTLVDLTYKNGNLFGRLNHLPPNHPINGSLIFPDAEKFINIILDDNLAFQCPSPIKIKSSQIAYVQVGEFKSLSRWIDAPDELAYYGSRSYHQRISASLDTVSGTEDLFYELMKFMDITKITTPDELGRTRSQNGDRNNTKKPNIYTEPVPEPSQFIVPERDEDSKLIIDDYTRVPYDKRIRSLRDLLSLILLNLSHTPDDLEKTPAVDDIDNDEKQPEYTISEIKKSARERISNYIVGYCKKYNTKLTDAEIIREYPLQNIVQKHFTLSRVLLEFNTHVEEFTSSDFLKCYWWIWAPFVWPDLFNSKGNSSLFFVSESRSNDEFKKMWNDSYLSEIFVIMTSLAIGPPISWSLGLHMPNRVNIFLAARELIKRFESEFGIMNNIEISADKLGISQFEVEKCETDFSLIRSYLPPVRERISPIFKWKEFQKNGIKPTSEFFDCISNNKLQGELDAYIHQPQLILDVYAELDDEGRIYCPLCGAALRDPAVRRLMRGKLTLCTASADAWLYKREELDKSNLI